MVPSPSPSPLQLVREDLERDPLVPADAVRLWLRLQFELDEHRVPCRLSPVPQAWDFDGPVSRDLASVAVDGCLVCPVRRLCLQYALAADERFGVWGALRPDERAALAEVAS